MLVSARRRCSGWEGSIVALWGVCGVELFWRAQALEMEKM